LLEQRPAPRPRHRDWPPRRDRPPEYSRVGARFPRHRRRPIPKRRIGPLSQHFLLSATARSLSIAHVARMSDEEAHEAFKRLRWSENAGEPFCPKCGCLTVWAIPSRGTWQCKACNKQFLHRGRFSAAASYQFRSICSPSRSSRTGPKDTRRSN
jgi:ribosomal protein L37AE/L43A